MTLRPNSQESDIYTLIPGKQTVATLALCKNWRQDILQHVAEIDGHGLVDGAHLQEGELLLQGAQQSGRHVRKDLRQRGRHATVEAQQVRRALRCLKQRPRLWQTP